MSKRSASAKSEIIKPFTKRWFPLDEKAQLLDALASPFVKWEVKSPVCAVFQTDYGCENGEATVLLLVTSDVSLLKNATTKTAYVGPFYEVEADFHAPSINCAGIDKQTMLAFLHDSLQAEQSRVSAEVLRDRKIKKRYRARIHAKEMRALCLQTQM